MKVKKAQPTPEEKGFRKACQATKTTRYLWSLQVLWPNLTQVFWRVTGYLGPELCNPEDRSPVLHLVLSGTRDHVLAFEESEKVDELNLDRNVLVESLRAILHESARVFYLNVRVEDQVWNPGVIGFPRWRKDTPGHLNVAALMPFGHDHVPQEFLEQVAKHIIAPEDWDLLGDDGAKLWVPAAPRNRGSSQPHNNKIPQFNKFIRAHTG